MAQKDRQTRRKDGIGSEERPLLGQRLSWMCWCPAQIRISTWATLLLSILVANCSELPLLQRIALGQRSCTGREVRLLTSLPRYNLQPIAHRGVQNAASRDAQKIMPHFLLVPFSWIDTSKDIFHFCPMKIIKILLRRGKKKR